MNCMVKMWKLRAVACFHSQTSTRNIPDIFLLYILHKCAQILEEMEMIAVPITVRYFLCLLACVSGDLDV